MKPISARLEALLRYQLSKYSENPHLLRSLDLHIDIAFADSYLHSLIIGTLPLKQHSHRSVDPLPPLRRPSGDSHSKCQQHYDDKTAHIRCKNTHFFRD